MSGVVIFGTRPEAIKLAPVVECLRKDGRLPDFQVICTGQHAEIIRQTLGSLNFSVNENMNLMRHNQTPREVVERITVKLSQRLGSDRPDWVLVQGDTATAFAGTLFGYLGGSTVIHLEAGLRTHDIYEPWPEEGFRQEIARLAGLHLAPYSSSVKNLLTEGIPENDIRTIGNPGLDTLKATLAHCGKEDDSWLPDGDFFLVTIHRRENVGERLKKTCRNLQTLLSEYPQYTILWPVHPNPKVRQFVLEYFSGLNDRVLLCAPLEYPQFLRAQAAASVVISDSGGVQEEAASLGTRVAVVREKTERPDVASLGLTKIVGADARGLSEAALV
ncbi:MAG: UDP-N-acetylglucosamine 2-epimerase (non-hydrolyzing), partial [Gammaproteobacteria bacterium]|nr:UDP-N-acetylglucosamine 2-epimerase (non-hydrolyzing) [Gammaproteobacteria bacterium]